MPARGGGDLSARGASRRPKTLEEGTRGGLVGGLRSMVRHARAVLQAWQRDYDEERPHSKLAWMTPRAYASALSGEAGRDAVLLWGPAPRPLAAHEAEGSDHFRTLVIAG
jgi:hypothetical protein